MSDMLKLFDSARRVSVPILVIRTTDQWATIAAIRAFSKEEHPLVQYDAAQGLTSANDPEPASKDLGRKELRAAGLVPDETVNFVTAMTGVLKLPQRTVVFVHNAQRLLLSQEPIAVAANVQVVANLRDQFKLNYRMLVLLCPEIQMPPELRSDVIIIDHPLPGPEELRKIIVDIYASAKSLGKPSDEILDKGVDAISGLSEFEAEQQTSMSLTEQGLDLHALWERKRVTIEQTPGLSVWRGTERFADLIGLDAIKEQMRLRLHGSRPIGVVVWIDEIDKALANVEQDTSGVRMYQLMKLLTEMENNEWPGVINVGVAGGGKSAMAKSFGNEAGVPTIALDLGATESKYVGESEANLNRAIEVIKAIGRGHAYFIATSNAATIMRPELQRRFFDGMWMFDLMSAPERKATWAYYLKKYGLKDKALPADDAWTGAEIGNACRFASDTRTTVVQAAQFIVPMARGRAKEIEELRRFAHMKFLDAIKGGPYHYTEEPMAKQRRAIDLPPLSVDALTQGLATTMAQDKKAMS